MVYYAAIEERLFTTKLGNSFKCTSKQIFSLEKNFQLLFINMQLQAFDMVSNQFGKGKPKDIFFSLLRCLIDKSARLQLCMCTDPGTSMAQSQHHYISQMNVTCPPLYPHPFPGHLQHTPVEGVFPFCIQGFISLSH